MLKSPSQFNPCSDWQFYIFAKYIFYFINKRAQITVSHIGTYNYSSLAHFAADLRRAILADREGQPRVTTLMELERAIAAPRTELAGHAPRISTI